MPEEQSPEQIEFMSQLEIQLSVVGVKDTRAALQEIVSIDQQLLKDVSALKTQYGGFDKAIAAIIKRHNARAAAAKVAGGIEQKNIRKLRQGYDQLKREVRGYSKEVTRAGAKMLVPASLGNAISTTLEYNKSLLATAANVNRLGIGIGYLQKSLERVSRETTLTRKETVELFSKYQESMRFVSLQQFEGMLKRIQTIVGANAQEMGKMQSAIAAVSQEYPGLAMGLVNMKKASGGMAAAEKAILQERVRNLYFIGKISDAQYKQITSYVSGSQQVIGADKARQREMQAQIEATNRFKQQWEKVSHIFGRALLPSLQKLGNFLEKGMTWIDGMNLSAGKLALTFAGIWAGAKIGGGILSAGLPMLARGGIRGVGSIWSGRAVSGAMGIPGKAKGGILAGITSLFGRKGRVIGKVATAGAGVVMGEGTRVFVTNWPIGLGGGVLGGAGTGPGGMKNILGGGKLSLLGRMKGVVAAKGGYGGFLKGQVPSMLGKVGIGIGLEIGSRFAKGYGRSLEKQGKVKTGAAVGLGGSLLGIGSLAAAGAALGSVVPVIGTALGGAAGALIGVAKEWKNLVPGFQKLFAKSDKEKEAEKATKSFEGLAEKVEKELAKSAKYEKSLETQKEIDLAKAGEVGIAKMYEKISANIVEKRKVMEEARKVVDSNIAAEIGKAGYGDSTIKGQIAIVNKMKEVIDERGDYEDSGGDKEREKDQATLKAAKEKLDKMNEISDKQEEINDHLKDATRQYNEQNSRLESILTLMAKYKDLASGLGGLYQSQVKNIDAIIKKMSIAGQIDASVMLKSMKSVLGTLDAEVSAQREYVKILTMQDKVARQAAIDEQSENKNLSKAMRTVYKQLSDIGLKGMDQIDINKNIAEAEANINGQLERRTELLAKVGNMYADTLELIQAQATGVGLLVQLADNYAIGVGASVQLRMKEFKIQSDVILILKDKLQDQKTAVMIGERDNIGAEKNRVLRAIAVKTENEILQAQIKQASSVKSMRDAWISAIAAMNTGMGSFTEIIMNAEQNTASIQRLDGAVRSSVSGAYALRDAFGRVIEDVGFAWSERMTGMGDIVARGGRRPEAISYETGRPYGHDTTKAIERILRGETSMAVDKLTRGAESVGKEYMSALVAGANEITKSAQTMMGAGDYINAAGESLYDGVNKASKNIAEAAGRGGGISSAGAGMGSDFSMGGGFTSMYIGPPKDFGEWTKAMEDAPKGTLPRLVVNQKADAIPVFVVNLKDIQGIKGGPTEKGIVEKKQQADAAARERETESVVVVEKNRKEMESLRIGLKEILELVPAGAAPIRVSETLKQEDISDDMKNALKYLRAIGIERADYHDVQDALIAGEKSLARIKEEAIRKELAFIEVRKKAIEKLKIREKELVAQRDVPRKQRDAIQGHMAAIAKREKNIEIIQRDQTGPADMFALKTQLSDINKRIRTSTDKMGVLKEIKEEIEAERKFGIRPGRPERGRRPRLPRKPRDTTITKTLLSGEEITVEISGVDAETKKVRNKLDELRREKVYIETEISYQKDRDIEMAATAEAKAAYSAAAKAKDKADAEAAAAKAKAKADAEVAKVAKAEAARIAVEDKKVTDLSDLVVERKGLVGKEDTLSGKRISEIDSQISGIAATLPPSFDPGVAASNAYILNMQDTAKGLEKDIGMLDDLRKKVSMVEGMDIGRESQRRYIGQGRQQLIYRQRDIEKLEKTRAEGGEVRVSKAGGWSYDTYKWEGTKTTAAKLEVLRGQKGNEEKIARLKVQQVEEEEEFQRKLKEIIEGYDDYNVIMAEISRDKPRQLFREMDFRGQDVSDIRVLGSVIDKARENLTSRIDQLKEDVAKEKEDRVGAAIKAMGPKPEKKWWEGKPIEEVRKGRAARQPMAIMEREQEEEDRWQRQLAAIGKQEMRMHAESRKQQKIKGLERKAVLYDREKASERISFRWQSIGGRREIPDEIDATEIDKVIITPMETSRAQMRDYATLQEMKRKVESKTQYENYQATTQFQREEIGYNIMKGMQKKHSLRGGGGGEGLDEGQQELLKFYGMKTGFRSPEYKALKEKFSKINEGGIIEEMGGGRIPEIMGGGIPDKFDRGMPAGAVAPGISSEALSLAAPPAIDQVNFTAPGMQVNVTITGLDGMALAVKDETKNAILKTMASEFGDSYFDPSNRTT